METNLIAFVLPTHLPGMGGWGNGYVAISKGHPCYEMDYDSIHSKYRSVDCHGGLTFAAHDIRNQPEETKGMWIVGFDTLHYGDTISRWPDEATVMAEANKLKMQLQKIGQRSHAKDQPTASPNLSR